MSDSTKEKIHFVTGKLAEFALRAQLDALSEKASFEFTIDVLPITVAALMSPKWIAKHINVPVDSTRIILPGHCSGDLNPLRELTDIPIQIGPKDLRKLPQFFGIKKSADKKYGEYDIEIIAEINHAPRLTPNRILQLADSMRSEGANLIDVGCEPGETWSKVGDIVAMLVAEGHRCSVDSLNPIEIAKATSAGAELVLSVNSTNVEYAKDWGAEVVVIPDQFDDLQGLEPTIEKLAKDNVPIRIDPILEPIGFGFAKSLQRYMTVRERFPDAEMMMGIGNLTELTDVDSAGINVLLLAICQELSIRSVLTTQVINWAKSSVKECDIGRRLAFHAINEKVPPKHLSDELVVLRDPEVSSFGIEAIEALAKQIKDHNYRIIAEDNSIHLMGNGMRFSDSDPFVAFDALMDTNPKNVDASHAFYLGYEMCKAMIANQLGKEYRQDEALHWGHLTEPEIDRHRLKKRKKS